MVANRKYSKPSVRPKKSSSATDRATYQTGRSRRRITERAAKAAIARLGGAAGAAAARRAGKDIETYLADEAQKLGISQEELQQKLSQGADLHALTRESIKQQATQELARQGRKPTASNVYLQLRRKGVNPRKVMSRQEIRQARLVRKQTPVPARHRREKLRKQYIGSVPYEVVDLSKMRRGEGDYEVKAGGMYEGKTGKVYLSKTLSKDKYPAYLSHEITHSIDPRNQLLANTNVTSLQGMEWSPQRQRQLEKDYKALLQKRYGKIEGEMRFDWSKQELKNIYQNDTQQRSEELFAGFGETFPEEILQPTTKTGRWGQRLYKARGYKPSTTDTKDIKRKKVYVTLQGGKKDGTNVRHSGYDDRVHYRVPYSVRQRYLDYINYPYINSGLRMGDKKASQGYPYSTVRPATKGEIAGMTWGKRWKGFQKKVLGRTDESIAFWESKKRMGESKGSPKDKYVQKMKNVGAGIDSYS